RRARRADGWLAGCREEAPGRPAEPVGIEEVAGRFASADVDLRLEPATVVGDEAALERAVSNLVENARRHGPAGGRITISVVAEADRATLSVEDEGEGPTAPEHAFERFWRESPDGAGSGLGLAIVRATAERHGGRASVAGSRFTIHLPAFRNPSENVGRVADGTLEKGTSSSSSAPFRPASSSRSQSASSSLRSAAPRSRSPPAVEARLRRQSRSPTRSTTRWPRRI